MRSKIVIKLKSCDIAQGLVEYELILSIVSIIIIGGLALVSGVVADWYDIISREIPKLMIQ